MPANAVSNFTHQVGFWEGRSPLYVYMHACMYVYVSVYVYVNVNVYVHVYMYMNMCKCTKIDPGYILCNMYA